MRIARMRGGPTIATAIGSLAVIVLLAGSAPTWRSAKPSVPPESGPRRDVPTQKPSVAEPEAEAASASRATAMAAPEPPPRLAALPSAQARTDVEALLADAREARRRGDLRATLASLQAAVERGPTVETNAALGGLYLELGAPGLAETRLRAALEGDPDNADRWIALANALALKPDPMAAADALAHARAAEPSLRVVRDAAGWLAREPIPATP